MALEKVVISFEGDASALQPVLTKLKEMGTISDQNAEKFKQAQKKHTAALGDTGTEVGRLENRFQSLTERMIAAFALDRIINFGGECIKAFEEAETAAKKLAFAVENINGGGASGLSLLTKQAEELSDSLKDLFSVKQIENVQTQLAQAKISTEQITRLIPIILDVSAKTGDSLDTVTEKIISTSQLGGRALTQYGAKFGDTGDKVKNLDLAMQQLKGFTGGAADALNTYAGAEQAAANKADDLMEKLGSELTPIWVDLKTAVLETTQSVIDFFNNKDFLDDTYTKQATAYAENIKKLDDKQLADQQTYYDAEYDQLVKSYQNKVDADKKYQDALAQGASAGKESAIYDPKQKQADEDKLKMIEEYQDAIIKEQQARDQATGKAKADADINKSLQIDLTKVTDDELQKRLDDLTDNMGQMYYVNNTWDQKGINAEEERIRKEQERRKKAYDDAIAQKQKFENTLVTLEQTIREGQATAEIDDIKDKNKQELAQEEEDHRKKIVVFKTQRKELNEILLKGDATEIAEAKLLLQQLDKEEEAELKTHLDKMAVLQEQGEEKIIDAQKEAQKRQLDFQNDFEDEMLRQGKISLKKKLDDGEITQKQYDLKIAQQELAAAKDKQKNTLASDQTEIDALQLKIHKKQQLGIDEADDVKDLDAALKKMELDKLKTADDINDKLNTVKEQQIENGQELLKNFLDFVTIITTNIQDAIQANIDAIDTQITAQDRMVEYQKTLAEKGLANDLAFEERRADELAKKKLSEQRKLERAKELETFLNSVAKFSEDNPNSAVAKALGVLAATKAAETLFAEEGGVVGSRLPSAYGRRHRSGRDRLVLAEEGEGILSKREMDLLGGEGGFMKIRNFIKDPLRERMIPSSSVAMMRNDNSELVKELAAIKKAVEQIPQMKIEWDGLDARIETKIQSGVTERMKVVTGKRRL